MSIFSNLADFYSLSFPTLGLCLSCSPTMKPRPVILRRWVTFAPLEASLSFGSCAPVPSAGGGRHWESEVSERAVGGAGRHQLSPHEDSVSFWGLRRPPSSAVIPTSVGVLDIFPFFLQCGGQTEGGQLDPHTQIPARDHHRGPRLRREILRL